MGGGGVSQGDDIKMSMLERTRPPEIERNAAQQATLYGFRRHALGASDVIGDSRRAEAEV